MKLKASVAVAALAISLSAGARAETCRCAHQSAPRAAALPVVVEEYYPHSDRSPAPVNAAYAPPANYGAPPSDTYGFDDFDYDVGYDGSFGGGYGLGGYGYWRDGRDGRSWDNDRGGGPSRVRPGRSSMGRR